VLLRRLIKIADCRLPFADQVARLRQQRQWLIDLEHLLDPPKQPDQLPPTSQSVAQAVDHYLAELLAKAVIDKDEESQRVTAHIDETFRNRWWGLFTRLLQRPVRTKNVNNSRYSRLSFRSKAHCSPPSQLE
jgi:hypothetical protein